MISVAKKINLRFFLIISIVLVVVYWGIQDRYLYITGHTMGTVYRITVKLPRWQLKFNVKHQIEDQLQLLNKAMSTYDPNSEISQFNRHDYSPFKISSNFYEVLQYSHDIYNQSQGTWDPTSYPLIKIWQAWINGSTDLIPSQSDINQAQSVIGWTNLQLLPNRNIQKKNTQLQLDLSSIAKGYGVDQIASLLQKLGSHDYLVEIGGEVTVSGSNPNGKEWKMGIELPQYNTDQSLFGVISLPSNMAMASSGKYRQYRDYQGKRLSHIIDPRTGYPSKSSVVGVSVVSQKCVISDGLATALMILTIDEGVEMIKKFPGSSALFFLELDNGQIITRHTKAFPDIVLN